LLLILVLFAEIFLVARHVSEDATAAGCQSRYQRTVDPTVKRGSWTAEEDEKLLRAVTVYNHSWVEIAALIPGRTNDQCRDRWSDCLNPALVKGKWTAKEDQLLIQSVETLGGKWQEISERLGNGRTDGMVHIIRPISNCCPLTREFFRLPPVSGSL
jgi:hypothetical protein